jgi:hypothetical protein
MVMRDYLVGQSGSGKGFRPVSNDREKVTNSRNWPEAAAGSRSDYWLFEDADKSNVMRSINCV